MTRRVLLRAGLLTGAGTALAGCGLFGGGDEGGGPEGAAPEADDDAPGTGDLAAALAAEEALLDAHRATLQRHPALQPRLGGLQADHEEHRRVLLALLVEIDPDGGWASTPAGSAGPPDPPPSPEVSGPREGGPPAQSPSPVAVSGVPTDLSAAVAALRLLEQEAASARTEQAVRTDARWAPLLGVLAASEAAHAAVLAA